MNREDQVKAEREIAELEEKSYGKPSPSAEASEEVEENAADASESENEELTDHPAHEATGTERDLQKESADVADSKPTPSVDKDDWKKRFTNYKSSSDATINGLRREVVSLREALQHSADAQAELNRRINELSAKKPDNYDDLFTEEEREIIGPETLAALQKAQSAVIERKLKPLEEQLNRERAARREQERRDL
jgi:hypothetical protein